MSKPLKEKLWDFSNELRGKFHLKQSEYYKPVLGALFLKYMDVNYHKTLEKIKENFKSKGNKHSPNRDNFIAEGVIMLPEEAQFSKILNIPEDVASQGLKDENGRPLNNLGSVLDNAMKIIEKESNLFGSALFKEYHKLGDDTLRGLLNIFEGEDVSENSDKLGEVYEYFLGKFSLETKGDEGVYFTPKSLVNMIVNILEPTPGLVFDPACGSGGMFVGIKNYMDECTDWICKLQMTFNGYELLTDNVNICNMNLFMHNIQQNSTIKECNTFYSDPLSSDLVGKCDYVLSNPPFCVKGVKIEDCQKVDRLPFGLPRGDKDRFTNADYLWISYFYSYLSPKGKAGFVMGQNSLASSADKHIRKQIIETKHIDIIIGVADKFFQSGFSGEVCLWFFNKQKDPKKENKILFIDASNYFTPVKENPSQNTWNYWQSKNLIAIVWLYRGQIEKYKKLLGEYEVVLKNYANKFQVNINEQEDYLTAFKRVGKTLIEEGDRVISSSEKKKQKEIKEEIDKKWEEFEEAYEAVKAYYWILSKFEQGIYRDISGLCKAVDIEEVAEMDYCLGPRVYVGSEETPEDIEDRSAYIERMKEMHEELIELERESQELTNKITENLFLWGA